MWYGVVCKGMVFFYPASLKWTTRKVSTVAVWSIYWDGQSVQVVGEITIITTDFFRRYHPRVSSMTAEHRRPSTVDWGGFQALQQHRGIWTATTNVQTSSTPSAIQVQQLNLNSARSGGGLYVGWIALGVEEVCTWVTSTLQPRALSTWTVVLKISTLQPKHYPPQPKIATLGQTINFTLFPEHKSEIF